jgi:HK97 family phage major capsid protein
MKPDEMNLTQVVERLSKIDDEVRSATEVKKIEELTQEKTDLIARKGELENLETRRQTALDIQEGKKEGKVLEARGKKEADPEDKYATLEYRKAFMDYCRTGKEIPAEYRSDTFSAVADAAAVIPTTIMNEIIKEMKVYGQLFNRVRKTNIPGGVRVPILSLKPTATRITADGTTSERKKITANTYVSFSYYGLECRVAVGLLTSAVTLPMFEQQITPLITEAMVKAQEIEIIKGTGEGQMLGVTVDTRVAAGQSITLSSAEVNQWDSWKKKVFAKIPLAYRAGGIFIMGAGTFDGYIDGMVDANGQPIGRVNYNITDGQAQRFGGKEVLLVEEDVVASYESASTGDVIAVFMNPQDYAINSNMQMAMYRWFDHDTNQWVDKAILINDGKLLDAAGVLLIKKGA